MKFFTAAVAAFVLITACFAAHSDRSRQRSSGIRSVPVAANVKRDTEFDCPEEFGYYPHPTDCTMYYVCVFGGALLESCTGGLMYSHELQTCDWPRNVGCDATSAVGGDEYERLKDENEQERETLPPPPPPPRRNPPPPPRVQPNPVVTSRGQPKFSREEYEKQQQLYAVDDELPPVEEIDTDRQQRVYRGQPSTIGQVQKDRDGYVAQPASSSRTLNSNIIPSSISQNRKVGSFSFGTQVDERRVATATQVPQTYSDVPLNNVTDLFKQTENVTDVTTDVNYNLNDIFSNDIEYLNVTNSFLKRIKRDSAKVLDVNDKLIMNDTLTKRNDRDIFEYLELKNEQENYDDDEEITDTDRDKRQAGYILKNRYKLGGVKPKPIQFVDFEQFAFSPNIHNPRYQQNVNSLNENNAAEVKKQPQHEYSLSSQNPYLAYEIDNSPTQAPFKPSLPDPYSYKPHNPMNHATQIITKSPPISALKQNENPFSALAGGFYNNMQQSSNRLPTKPAENHNTKFSDSSHSQSTVIIGQSTNNQANRNKNVFLEKTKNRDFPKNIYNNGHEYDDDEEEDDENNEESSENNYKHDFVNPSYKFSHTKNKFENIESIFSEPNFDFDEFLAKLRHDHYKTSTIKTKTSNTKTRDPLVEATTPFNSATRGSTNNYKGMSTPRPFSVPTLPSTISPNENFRHNFIKQTQSQQPLFNGNTNNYSPNLQSAGSPFDAIRPKLKPPNFKDDRQLPINYNFNRPLEVAIKTTNSDGRFNYENGHMLSTTLKPYILISGTGSPILVSTPRQQYIVKPDKLITIVPNAVTNKPFVSTTTKPDSEYYYLRQPTPKPNNMYDTDQYSDMQQFWKNPYLANILQQSSFKPTSDLPKLESLFPQVNQPVGQIHLNTQNNIIRNSIATTTKTPPRRKPIPKPSPEMNDYFYDDDDEKYFYEPPVKSQYMPSTEVRPKRPLMSQNNEEYEDSDENISEEEKPNDTKLLVNSSLFSNTNRPETATVSQNVMSSTTKSTLKVPMRALNGKIPVPVMVDFVSPMPTLSMRPEVSMFELTNLNRNKTIRIRRPTLQENGPSTQRPPKYLNQTTLRPYTVRHRLAKPTTLKDMVAHVLDMKQIRGKMRHQNLVAQLKFTTPRDNNNQDSRLLKLNHDDKKNSLEPTESIAPQSYSPSPRPKMLYNGSQSYNPDQFDPYYAVYDEDGELYKDTEYVQQYNTASLRPAVQQTYRGTPPPARRPVETYTQRPSLEDYDDALLQGPINNQNHYQTPVRQPSRGEGNDLGFDQNPSIVTTSIFEATSLSTTPSTTSTTFSTTTQRPTTALFTEAMYPSRLTTRSPKDENPIRHPESAPSQNPSDGSFNPDPLTSFPIINLSSHAKPFEKTGNSHRLDKSITSTDKLLSSSPYSLNKDSVAITKPSDKVNKKLLSLTTGFSIIRNSNNTSNPYTLTLLSRPFEDYIIPRQLNNENLHSNMSTKTEKLIELTTTKPTTVDIQTHPDINFNYLRRKGSEFSNGEYENNNEYKLLNSPQKPTIIATVPPSTPGTTKYFLKTIIKRPATLLKIDENKNDYSSKEIINNYSDATIKEPNKEGLIKNIYANREIENKESAYENNKKDSHEFISSPSEKQLKYNSITTSKPSYFTYHIIDDASDHTTEAFNGKVKNVLKSFFNNLSEAISLKPKKIADITVSTTAKEEEKVVNIGFHKKMLKIQQDKPIQNNIKRLQIVTEPPSSISTNSYNHFIDYHNPLYSATDSSKYYPETVTNMFVKPESTTMMTQSSSTEEVHIKQTKFGVFMPELREKLTTYAPVVKTSTSKFQKILFEEPSFDKKNDIYFKTQTDLTKPSNTFNDMTEDDKETDLIANDIASTTSTTKSTTPKLEQISLTKSLPYPTRASRINPAIKLAATNLGGGRRSYQSSSKCSSDNSLQANPKCNEIKYQRPVSTRGRGSAHYSTQEGNQYQPPNRGTPPTRNRPTLKPSTSIVSKVTEFVDIYTNPPRRPAPVYPQPTPDKTAAKCRKDVCLLPDCYCGGKDIPADLPVETVPQIVLLTFDDSVNDLNKVLYSDLFEKDRVNPNGCPISATFYVSHEWTDYSQVQNLYAAGHEMASHTISHSFGEQFSQKKWNREVAGQREILAAYGGVKLEDVRGMRAPFLSVGGNKMFKMLHDSNFTYDSSLPVYENRPPSWPYTLDYKLFHDCMIPPCPTKSYPGVWEVPMVMWQDLNGGRCSMGDACANPPDAEGVYKMLLKNFDRHYTTNRAPFGLFYHAAWFTQPHHKEGFIMFLDFINRMNDVWVVTNWQALQWVRDPTPISRMNNFQPFQCNYQDRPKKCNNPKVCNLWHKSGVRYMRTCQPCPEIYPWTGKTGIRSSRIDNDIEE